jgi:hypothetical protein
MAHVLLRDVQADVAFEVDPAGEARSQDAAISGTDLQNRSSTSEDPACLCRLDDRVS